MILIERICKELRLAILIDDKEIDKKVEEDTVIHFEALQKLGCKDTYKQFKKDTIESQVHQKAKLIHAKLKSNLSYEDWLDGLSSWIKRYDG